MAQLSLSQFAKAINVTPAAVTYLKKIGVLKKALIYREGKAKPLVDLDKGKELIKQFKDPNFGKNSATQMVKDELKKQQEPDLDTNLELLFEIADIVSRIVKERKDFIGPSTKELMKIAKTGNMRKLRAEITRHFNQSIQNVWFCFAVDIFDRYGTDLLGLENET